MRTLLLNPSALGGYDGIADATVAAEADGELDDVADGVAACGAPRT